MKQYLIGFDIGTLSSKSVLTDLDGNIISKFQSEHAIEVNMPDGRKKAWRCGGTNSKLRFNSSCQ